MSHQPDVLRDLAERLKREPRGQRFAGEIVIGDEVHEIPRAELVAAYDAGVLDLDRVSTALLLGKVCP